MSCPTSLRGVHRAARTDSRGARHGPAGRVIGRDAQDDLARPEETAAHGPDHALAGQGQADVVFVGRMFQNPELVWAFAEELGAIPHQVVCGMRNEPQTQNS
ncbi:hypothetical protein B0H21DRAFT_697983 [Amylocystis lapponica]|nr:hypothetical protein B0H21DRAFT_697983 [Amylocystis lapponica]